MSITIAPAIDTLSIGQTQQFSASIQLSPGIPPAGGALPQWTSANPAILELDAMGHARALSAGESVVQVSAGGKTASRSIRVVA